MLAFLSVLISIRKCTTGATWFHEIFTPASLALPTIFFPHLEFCYLLSRVYNIDFLLIGFYYFVPDWP